MKKEFVNKILIKGVYDFIKSYYKDEELADYIMSIFDVDVNNYSELNISYKNFSLLLGYLQKMSGDNLICYKAGIYLIKKKFFNRNALSLKKTYYKINYLLEELLPGFEIKFLTKEKSYIILEILNDEIISGLNYYFIELLRGILSSIPERWNLPLSDVRVMEYPFHIEELFNDAGIRFFKRGNKYLINEDIIAEDYQKNNITQLIYDELYLKDVFINKNVFFNTKSLNFRIRWNEKKSRSVLFNLINLLGFGAFLGLYYFRIIPLFNILLYGFIFQLIILLLRSYINTMELQLIYKINEMKYIEVLSEQREITSEAVGDTISRLHSLENVMEITKSILYEKNVASLFGKIRKLAAKALNADRATVFIHDVKNKELVSGPQFSDESEEFRIPENRGIAGEVLKLKKIVNVRDAYNNPNFNKSVDRQTGYNTSSLIGAPLLDLDGNLVGVIQVLNKRDGVFEKLDEQILKTLSVYITSALKDSIAIRELEKRGINPLIQNGLVKINKFIYGECVRLKQAFYGKEQVDPDDVIASLNGILSIISKILFIFDEQNDLSEKNVSSVKIKETCDNHFYQNSKNKQIKYQLLSTLKDEFEIKLDFNIFNNIIRTLILNSIEALDGKGNVEVFIYNYVKIPTEIIYTFNLQPIISKYNIYSSGNSKSFIEFASDYKPFMPEQVNKIEAAILKYIVIEVSDNGNEIDDKLKDQIFLPMYSIKNKFGLGLAYSQKGAKVIGGEIEYIKTRENEKSFRLIIPVK